MRSDGDQPITSRMKWAHYVAARHDWGGKMKTPGEDDRNPWAAVIGGLCSVAFWALLLPCGLKDRRS
jgi:hypothetical protein